MQSFVPRDAFALKIQREVCNAKCARKVSGLSSNGPQGSYGFCKTCPTGLSAEQWSMLQRGNAAILTGLVKCNRKKDDIMKKCTKWPFWRWTHFSSICLILSPYFLSVLLSLLTTSSHLSDRTFLSSMSWSMKDKCLWMAASYSCLCIANRCLASFSISFACLRVNSRCWFWSKKWQTHLRTKLK